MKSTTEIIEIAKKTLKIEANALLSLEKYINESFSLVVKEILMSNGRTIVTGVGKSAIVAQKIVATLNSTGTPSVFMHAADAIHGDLGIIQPDDIIICLSKSGNTPEIKVIVPLLKASGNKLIGMVGDVDSYLAKQADYVLNTTIDMEACPNNLAPTTSTTAQMALGDALAICLLECRAFTSDDFAKYHPGGILGKKLYLKVGELALQNEKPFVEYDASVKEVLVEITAKRLGTVAVIKENKLCGIITDGDIRRMIEKYNDFNKLIASDIMGNNPITINSDELAVNALEKLRKHNISQLIVLNNHEFFGVIHIHDLIKEGII